MEESLKRWPARLTDSGKFRLRERRFDVQFCKVYKARLAALRSRLLSMVASKWGGTDIIAVADLPSRSPEEQCVLIGTLYKHQELKPSVLRELGEELQVSSQLARSNYASFKDSLFLEDEYLRVKLTGDCLDVQKVVTGLVCAVLGFASDCGIFRVTDYCFPGRCPGEEGTVPCTDPGKILFVSGLNLTASGETLSLNLLTEWITGMAGDSQTQKTQASVVCTVIAGNSVRASVETRMQQGYFRSKSYDEAVFKESAAASRRLDRFLQQILPTCPVLLMPGEFDPVSHCVPQQPFHPCILPNSSRYSTFHGRTNPWMGQIGGRLIAGSSGQPIADILRVSSLLDRSPIYWLEKTLEWAHYAPTAPDTVASYPFLKEDPFVMDSCPDVYFAGNMNKFETKLSRGVDQETRLICIPGFAESKTAVLLDLEDLSCQTISFG